jgi:cytosine/adenosine deaminase-related metal-dependent hydrolase
MSGIRLITADTEIHRAAWIVADPGRIIQDGFIRTKGGIILEAAHGKPKSRAVDHGSAVLMPALVNAHTHLELTGLKGKISGGGGFLAWVRKMIPIRESLGMAALAESSTHGIAELKDWGCGAVGDISTFGLTWEALAGSGLCGVWFREYLGGAIPDETHCGDQSGQITASLAGHAPHTTHPEVLKRLKSQTRAHDLPFSIHLAESDEESEFLAAGQGQWADFLNERGVDFSSWGLPAGTPAAYADRLGLLDENTLAVHMIHAGKTDFEILKNRGVSVCICPRSNHRLYGRLPDVPGMLKAGLAPCLGTDSLASADTLNLFDDMAFLSQNFPSLTPADILAMSTVTGARALKLEGRLGTLSPGKYAWFVRIPVQAKTSSELLEKIIHETH